MESKKNAVKIIVVIILIIIYGVTNMAEKFNLFFLVILAAILGVAIHYIVEFIFNLLENKNK